MAIHSWALCWVTNRSLATKICSQFWHRSWDPLKKSWWFGAGSVLWIAVFEAPFLLLMEMPTRHYIVSSLVTPKKRHNQNLYQKDYLPHGNLAWPWGHIQRHCLLYQLDWWTKESKWFLCLHGRETTTSIEFNRVLKTDLFDIDFFFFLRIYRAAVKYLSSIVVVNLKYGNPGFWVCFDCSFNGFQFNGILSLTVDCKCRQDDLISMNCHRNFWELTVHHTLWILLNQEDP